MACIKIHFDADKVTEIAPTPSAEEAVRFKFNPSGLASVNGIKSLTSALITLLESYETNENQELIATAREKIVTASMWSVLAVTKGV